MSPKVSILAYISCAMLIAAIVLSGPASSAVGKHAGGKRFDCRVFCRLTGYHGTIGGCRCSFTLFTAKRAHPVWTEDQDVLRQDEFGLEDSSTNKILPTTITSHFRKKPVLNKAK
ncbi:hypothetical protein GHT06_013158 [Daphnia sinensis]|uniref:Uncharacterized protein n=1 Tax=Daphnia sinensis TaxID=1820382 RepID=A0AAD5KYX9_9CRUS|nr:hypothetical protein GHT06_013158 [Daphnia sinensis]